MPAQRWQTQSCQKSLNRVGLNAVYRAVLRDRDVAKPILDRPGVNAVIGELITAGMAEHVEVLRERQARALADDLDQPVDCIRHKRRAALGGEDIAAVGITCAARRHGWGGRRPCPHGTALLA